MGQIHGRSTQKSQWGEIKDTTSHTQKSFNWKQPEAGRVHQEKCFAGLSCFCTLPKAMSVPAGRLQRAHIGLDGLMNQSCILTIANYFTQRHKTLVLYYPIAQAFPQNSESSPRFWTTENLNPSTIYRLFMKTKYSDFGT